MFADIRGFTPFSEALELEQAVAILSQYLEVTTNTVLENGGIVDKFIGDTTMVLFNAPLNQEDHVFRVVRIGSDIAAAEEVLREDLLRLCGKIVSFGIDINCGEAVIGNTGTSSRMEYVTIGNTVNTAMRPESRAKAGEVLISPEVYKRSKNRIEVESLEPYTLKGISEPTETFRVAGVRYPARLVLQFSKR